MTASPAVTWLVILPGAFLLLLIAWGLGDLALDRLRQRARGKR